MPTAMTRQDLGRALLGPQFADPFAGFRVVERPRDMTFHDWYPHSSSFGDLAARLVNESVGDGGWLLEIGSFIGNSATAWARAIKQQ